MYEISDHEIQLALIMLCFGTRVLSDILKYKYKKNGGN